MLQPWLSSKPSLYVEQSRHPKCVHEMCIKVSGTLKSYTFKSFLIASVMLFLLAINVPIHPLLLFIVTYVSTVNGSLPSYW